jgi:RNA polymerase sigma-70 factor, ECF subfamily
VESQLAVTRALDGWERVYRAESPRLWRALLAYSGSPEIASDAVSEAFSQAIKRGDAIKDPAAWIWSVSFKTAAGELQRRAMSEPLGERDRGYEHSDPMPHVFAALRRLPPRQRAVIVLHDYADRPTDEIARTLGMRRPTVHVHLSQGRKRLRRLLDEGDE